MLSVYVLRFMTLGSKINSKFTNTSGLLTEQVRKGVIPLYHGKERRGRWGVLKGCLGRGEIPLYHVSGKRIGFPPGPRRVPPPPPPPPGGQLN